MKKHLNKFISALLCIALLSGCSAEKENIGSENSGSENNMTASNSDTMLSVNETATTSKEGTPKTENTVSEKNNIENTITSSANSTTPPAIVTTTAKEEEKPKSEEEIIRMKMIERSLISTGNTERIQKAITKAKNGEEVTLAYLGGSITQGVGATPDNKTCYAALSAKLFAEKFAEDENKVNYVNAGIAGTPSLLGITRCNNDIISTRPDVVFVEFAVNDGTDTTSRDVYESLVRKLLNSETSPAVVLIFTVLSNGYTAQDNMQAVGEHYDLGMISVREAITPEIDAGRMTFIGEYAVDEAHPSNFGHALISDFIGYYLDMAEAAESSPYTMPSDVQFMASFENLENITEGSEYIISNGDFVYGIANCFTYNKGWKRSGGVENSPIVMEFGFSKLTIAYKQVNSKTNGAADVYIDGEKVKTLKGYSENGWGNVVTEIVYPLHEAESHKVEIRMAEGDEEKEVTVLGIGYVR